MYAAKRQLVFRKRNKWIMNRIIVVAIDRVRSFLIFIFRSSLISFRFYFIPSCIHFATSNLVLRRWGLKPEAQSNFYEHLCWVDVCSSLLYSWLDHGITLCCFTGRPVGDQPATDLTTTPEFRPESPTTRRGISILKKRKWNMIQRACSTGRLHARWKNAFW